MSLLESTAAIVSATVIFAWSIYRVLVVFTRNMTQFPTYITGFRLYIVLHAILVAAISAVASAATSGVPDILVVAVFSVGHPEVV